MEKNNTTTKDSQHSQRVPPPRPEEKDLKARKHQGPTESSGHVKETEDGTIEENQEEQAP